MFGSDERQSIMGDYSTLATLDMALGANTASRWLVTLIGNLNMFIGAKNMDDNQTEWLARLLAQEYRDVKYSVIQLFFYRFKCGYFGKFYGKVDPMVITCALKDFLVECENKRQQYLNVEYERRRAEEDALRKIIREKWESCQNELWKNSPDEQGKSLFLSIGFLSYDDESKILFLNVSREEYDLIEGKYINVFSTVIRKHYPMTKVQYSLRRESVVTNEDLVKKNVEKKEHQQRDIQQGIESARAVIENKLGLEKQALDDMRYAFRLRYKHEPEEYLKTHCQNKKA